MRVLIDVGCRKCKTVEEMWADEDTKKMIKEERLVCDDCLEPLFIQEIGGREMREIKFRIWIEGDMYSDLGLTNVFLDYHHNYPVMQYTGLKDKNGVEIYEGDIVTVGQRGKTSTGVVKFGEHETSADYYTGTAQGFYLEDKNKDTFNLIYYGEEVVGNIYENSVYKGC